MHSPGQNLRLRKAELKILQAPRSELSFAEEEKDDLLEQTSDSLKQLRQVIEYPNYTWYEEDHLQW